MKAFLKHLMIQLKMDLRDRGILMNYYLVPLLFFFVLGPVFSAVSPLSKATLAMMMTLFGATMGSVVGLPTPVVHLRETGTLRAFRVNGIPGPAVLLVQAISAYVHLFVTSLVIYFAAPIAFHSKAPDSPGMYFAVLAVFLFTSVSLGMLIGVVARSQQFAMMLSMLIFLCSLFFSGLFFPASMLPKALVWVGRAFPTTHAAQALYGLAYHLKTDLYPPLSLCVVAGAGLVLATLAVIRFGRVSRNE